MRPKRTHKVKLVVPKYNKEQEFDLKHAERLLDMGTQLNGGWVLPENSNYTYDKYDGLRIKSDKANSAKAD